MGREERAGERANRGKLIAIGVLVVVLAIFIIANTETVNIDFVVTDVEMPLIFVLAVTALLGALIGAVLRRRRR